MEHNHTRPPPPPTDGVITSDTAVPIEELLPVTVMTPGSETEPPATRPPVDMVSPLPELVSVPSDTHFSETLILKLPALSTISDTLARIV